MNTSQVNIAIIPFRIASKLFGIPCQFVVRVLPSLLPTVVPGAPAAFDGVLNINGKVVVQFNLALPLGLVPPVLHQWRPLLWIKTRCREIVIPVDEVLPVVSIKPDAIAPAVDFDMPFPYTNGVVRMDNEMLLLQDPETFISSAHEISLSDALHAMPH